MHSHTHLTFFTFTIQLGTAFDGKWRKDASKNESNKYFETLKIHIDNITNMQVNATMFLYLHSKNNFFVINCWYLTLLRIFVGIARSNQYCLGWPNILKSLHSDSINVKCYNLQAMWNNNPTTSSTLSIFTMSRTPYAELYVYM